MQQREPLAANTGITMMVGYIVASAAERHSSIPIQNLSLAQDGRPLQHQ